jgi:hypothetical protein
LTVDPLTPPSREDAGIRSASDARASRPKVLAAITVALPATFLGICKVKDDQVVQAMRESQADNLDLWNFYQARSIRQEVAPEQLGRRRLMAAPSRGPPRIATHR